MELPSLAIVMPAYNAAHLLDRTLTAALEAAQGQEVIVVDPGSNDGTADKARSLGARVIELGHRGGPAEARNVGVDHVDTDVVFFIDSDCVAHPNAVERVRAAFAEHPDLVSLTGSYDDTPPERNFFSLYMNLRHHFVHQQAKRTDATFWTGCGAVRRKDFLAVGGFDMEQFPMPMIEDIELGLRLKERGPTHLDPELHVTHLKRWTFKSVVETDIKNRAIPWTKLILNHGEMPNDLNLQSTQRVLAALAPFVLLGMVSAPVAALLGQWLLSGVLLVPGVVSALMTRDMIKFFSDAAGLSFAIRAWVFHQLHLIYSAATFATLTAQHVLRGGPLPNKG